MLWSYGVTTVPSRKEVLLPKTLSSLKRGGFECPWLFVDGTADYTQFDIAGTTVRSTPVRVHGNWILSLYELYIRNPIADRYAVFQDDVVCCRNLRTYLESLPYPDKGYLNLYTEPRNEACIPMTNGFYPSNQRGLGALALVFTRQAVLQLLVADHMAMRPIPATPTALAELKAGVYYRGQHSVDGGIVTAFAQAGWKEYVHRPSLVQHIGATSSFRPMTFKPSAGFPGETFDATSMLV
jgi:hypothetical protein